MATTATVFTPTGKRFSYIATPGGQLPSVPIPHAEILFTVNAGVVTAAASGEDQQFSITCNLGDSFAYVLDEAVIQLLETEAGDVADWGTGINAYLRDGQSNANWFYPMSVTYGEAYNISAVLEGESACVCNPMRKVVLPVPGENAQLVLDQRNVVIDGGPMSVYFFARFLVFDLNQAHHWAINTPWPVR